MLLTLTLTLPAPEQIFDGADGRRQVSSHLLACWALTLTLALALVLALALTLTTLALTLTLTSAFCSRRWPRWRRRAAPRATTSYHDPNPRP